MARGPSRYELDNGVDISRMTVAQIDEALAQARHDRRLQLMRMQGSINRQERRLTWLWIIAGVLGVLALLGTMLS